MSWDHPHKPNEGATSEWWTPPSVFEAIGLEFDLDPCAPPLPAAPWLPVADRYSIPQDGLSEPWGGCVWLNPPYGKETGAWVERLAEHGHGIALVFARTDVRWWHRAVPASTGVCFVEGRLTFVAGAGQSAPGNSGGPSALIAYGDDCADALNGSDLGMTWMKVGRWERLHPNLSGRRVPA
jgi:DNA N-6-adenine-methyltransferase (Dam)